MAHMVIRAVEFLVAYSTQFKPKETTVICNASGNYLSALERRGHLFYARLACTTTLRLIHISKMMNIEFSSIIVLGENFMMKIFPWHCTALEMH